MTPETTVRLVLADDSIVDLPPGISVGYRSMHFQDSGDHTAAEVATSLLRALLAALVDEETGEPLREAIETAEACADMDVHPASHWAAQVLRTLLEER